jgi:hypothetical protein
MRMKKEDKSMIKLTFSAIALIALPLMAPAPAKADYLGGGALVNGSQCFTYTKGQFRDGRFGTWAACPQQASRTTIVVRGRNGRQPAAAAQPAASSNIGATAKGQNSAF